MSVRIQAINGANNIFEVTDTQILSNQKNIIDLNDTSALLVRKAGNTGDIFKIDTQNGNVIAVGNFQSNSTFNILGASFTDSTTLASGTVASWYGTTYGSPTYSATNTGVTLTSAATIAITGVPVAGTNVTITNAYALAINSGRFLSSDTTASTSSTVGSTLLSGGLSISNTTDATSSTNGGTLTSAGGGAFAKKLYVGGDLNVASTQTVFGGYFNFSGTSFNNVLAGILQVNNATASTSNTTGSFQLAGGIGISNTTDASSATNGGTLTSAGGAAFAKKVYIGGDLNVSSAQTVFGGYFNFSGTSFNNVLAGILQVTNTTTSTSNSTGSFQLSGGIGISNTTDATSSTNGGTLTSAGGAAIAKSTFIGTSLSVATTSFSNAPTSNLLTIGAPTFTDNSTASSGTVATWYASSCGAPVYAATNTSVTLTKTGTLYISGPPTAGTNVTITNTYSLIVNSGRILSTDTTASTSSTVGSTLLSGGLSISNSTDATSATNGGTITSAGGGAFAKTLYVGGNINMAATQTLSGGYFNFSGTSFNNVLAGILQVNNSTSSTSNSTGSFQLAGGIGISNTTDATSATNGGTLTSAGGGAFAKKVYIGGDLNVSSAQTVFGGYFNFSGTSFNNVLAGILQVTNTTTSTSNSTGSFQLSGGIGISNTTDATSSTNGGTLTSAGGAAIAKSTFIGTSLSVATSSFSNAPTSNLLTIGAPTFTDNSTAASGTVATWYASSYGAPVYAASNTSVTLTKTGTLYISGPPTAGTNVTITNAYALIINSGRILNSDTTASTSSTVGSTLLSGGLSISNTTDASSSTNGGTFTSAGGGAFAKTLYVGGNINMATTQTLSGGYLNFSGTSFNNVIAGVLQVTNSTASTSTSTGALVVTGGVGVGGNVNIGGSISKGSGTFDIPHPNPTKQEQGYRLKHSFVESPTAGDNIYRYQISITDTTEDNIIELPEYFPYLNENIMIWVNPVDSFGKGYGRVSDNKLYIYTDNPGSFYILVIGTRKDTIGFTNWNKQPIEYIP